MKKRLIKLFLAITMLANIFVVPSFAENNIKIFVDGSRVNFDVAPQIINNRTFVPMRAIFEALGAKVTWDSETKSALARTDDISVTATIDSNKLIIDGDTKTMDVAPQIVNNRTMVPARFVSEAFNADVLWDGTSQTIHITSADVLKNCYPNTIITSYGKVTGQKYIAADVMEGLVIYMYNCKTNSELEEYVTALTELGWKSDGGTMYEDKNMITVVFTKGDIEVDMTVYFDQCQVLIYFIGDKSNIEKASASTKSNKTTTSSQSNSSGSSSQNGSRQVECWVCYGQKYLTCNACHGKGTIKSYDVWSHKYIDSICPQGCNNGKILCPNCSGLGYRIVYD